jgi:CDP-glycerol glycerophosphotransferase (TagB/SpsB family)
LLLSPLHWLIYFASGFMPRSNEIWVFGSWDGHRFSDNSKWFFIYCNQNNKPERSIWISKDRKIVDLINKIGYESYYYLSFKGIWYSLRAKYYFIDHTSQDINFFLSRNAFLINQFHGIPLKKIRRDIRNKENFNARAFHGKWYEKSIIYITRPYIYEKMDYFAVTSPINGKIFSKAFGLPEECFHVTGHARNDVFLNRDIKLNSFDKKIFEKVKKYKNQADKLIMYLPTWRDHDRKREDPIEWDRLDTFLRQNNSVMIPKLHSYDALDREVDNEFSNIHFLHHSVDIYPLMEITDILITDYSSIYFDFLLTGKPVIFYSYDLDEYVSKARSLYYNYDDVTPGKKAGSFDELILSLEDVINDEEKYHSKWSDKYSEILDMSFTFKDGHSSKRLYESIKNKL